MKKVKGEYGNYFVSWRFLRWQVDGFGYFAWIEWRNTRFMFHKGKYLGRWPAV